MCGLTASLNFPYLSLGVFPSLRKLPYLGQMCEMPILSISLDLEGGSGQWRGFGVIIQSQITI